MLTRAVDQSALARVLGISEKLVNLEGVTAFFLPMQIVVLGQGRWDVTYSLDKRVVTTALEAAEVYGFGSPIHLACLELIPPTGGGVGTIPVTILPLSNDTVGAVTSFGDFDGVGTQTESAAYRLKINNILSNEFVLEAGEVFADKALEISQAVDAVLEMPVIASVNVGVVEFTSKWRGESANDIYIEVVGEEAGITFAITQPTGGLINPDVSTALDKIGNTWQTIGINCLNKTDTVNLDRLQEWTEGRWNPLIHKPMLWFVGDSNATVNGAITIPETRKDDRVNSQLVEPSSNDLPLVIAAAEATKIAVQANNNPPVDYGSIAVSSLNPAADELQWDYKQRDTAVKGGSSTIEVIDGVVNLSDIVTMFHPTGDVTPAYRYVVDVFKIMNIIFNVNLIFKGKPWDGAPLLDNAESTDNPEAKKPKDAVAELSGLTDDLGRLAILTDTANTKPLIRASIGDQNAKRLDLKFPVKIVGNANIISIDLEFSFNFGS